MARLSTVHELFNDSDFRNRVTASVITQDIKGYGHDTWFMLYGLKVAATPEIMDAYEYSLATAPYHSRRCYDPNVITDEQINKAVAGVNADINTAITPDLPPNIEPNAEVEA